MLTDNLITMFVIKLTPENVFFNNDFFDNNKT